MSLQNIELSFGDHEVLKGVSLDVHRGETLCILGGSGVGKSTVLRLILRLIHPTAGDVLIEGRDITTVSQDDVLRLRERMGMVFQGSALFDSLTVRDNVAFPLYEHTRQGDAEIEARVREVLTFVDLEPDEILHLLPAELSGGMRKRVALARAVVSRPDCIFYDEPHAGLDPVTADKIDRLIKRLESEHGITNIVVTHEMRSVFRIADRVLFIRGGVVYWEGTAAELKVVEDPVLRDFIDGNSGTPWEQS